MKIRSLTLHGFKSFADKTRIDFHDGMTAIVGPNGCGKSNISDALRWVLGEQRPTAIRGSRMEEAIFQGTTERRPIHRAEVALSLSNEDGLLALPYSEVVIGRTVLRGGDSAYTLNESACRLRDLHDLCRDTGLGSNAYSIIEGRMVDAILSDRADERRVLFEEAAEVGRYKDRRRTAQRRLDQAEQDLKRLEDVLAEVGSKVRSLARQRGRARRHGDLRQRRLRLEVALARERLERLDRRLGETEEQLAGHRDRRPGQETRLQTLETEAETARLRIVERERERSQLASELEQVRTGLEEIERHRLLTNERVSGAEARARAIRTETAAIEERRASVAREIDELGAAIATAGAELDRHRAAAAELADDVEALRAAHHDTKKREQAALGDLERIIRAAGALQAERQALRERVGEWGRELDRRRRERARYEQRAQEAESRLAAAEEAAGEKAAARREAEARLVELREQDRRLREQARAARESVGATLGELAALEARHASLTALRAEGRDRPPVVADLLATYGPDQGVFGVLADFIDVPPDQARAVEACLGGLLHALIVRDWSTVLALREWLDARDGEEGLILLPVDPGPRRPAGQPAEPLAETLAVREPATKWVQAILSEVSADAAPGFEPRDGAWVTADGSGQDRLGAVRLGPAPGAGGALRRMAELSDLGVRLAELKREREARTEALGALAEEVAALGTALLELDEKAARAAEADRGAQAEREEAADALRRARSLEEEVGERISELEALLESHELEVGEGPEGDLQQEREEAEGRLEAEREGALNAAGEWERGHAALQDRRLVIARAEAELTAQEGRSQRARDAAEELEARALRLEAELAESEATVSTGRARLESSEAELVELLERRRALDGRLREMSEWLQERRQELEEREVHLRKERLAEREEAELRHALELEVTELKGLRATVRERLEAEWEATFEELMGQVEPPEEGDAEAWSEEVERIRTRLAGLGPVNLLAAQEYEEEKTRLDFLEEQKSDLERAKQDLHASIERINEAASISFMSVFEEVRTNFQKIFVTLFEGGECDLWLEDPTEPLDSPIEISASPRGKRTQRIHLLSGGERALTALALLFAIYLTKPSPFCVMDEVDAPLDETNIGRFTAMLDKFKSETQFIVITHNPRTIEAADWVYGVTMQEPGVSSLVGVELHELPRGQVA